MTDEGREQEAMEDIKRSKGKAMHEGEGKHGGKKEGRGESVGKMRRTGKRRRMWRCVKTSKKEE